MTEPAGSGAIENEPIQVLVARGDNVRLARCRRTGRLVVVTACPEIVATGARPAVGHTVPSVADVLGVGVGKEPRVVTAWVQGITLHEQVLLEGPLDSERARGVLLATRAGLRALHALGAIHGFISPRAIVLEADGKEPVLTHAAPVGDPRWWSPSRLRNGSVSAADDEWALQWTMLCALRGGGPFPEGSRDEDVLRAIEAGRVRDMLDDCPATVRPLLGGLEQLSGAPPTNAGGGPLPTISESPTSVAVQAPPPPCPPNPAASAKRRSWRLWGVVAGIVLGIVAVMGMVFVHRLLACRNQPGHPADAISPPVPTVGDSSAPPSRAAQSPGAPMKPRAAAPRQSAASSHVAENVGACVRRHFLPGTFPPDGPLEGFCDIREGRAAVLYVTRSVVVTSGGRLTDAMNEWSRLRGFQPVAVELVRHRCCAGAEPLVSRGADGKRMWEAVEVVASAVRTGELDGRTLGRFRRAARHCERAWWYRSPPCTGGQAHFDRFAGRNGWPVRAAEVCAGGRPR